MARRLLAGPRKAAAISRHVSVRFAFGHIPATSFQAGSIQLQETALVAQLSEVGRETVTPPASPTAKHGFPGAPSQCWVR